MSRRFSIPSHVVARELDGEMVLLNVESGSYFGLNAVGALIWAHLADGASLATAHDALSREFDVASDVLERDMLELIDSLESSKLIEART